MQQSFGCGNDPENARLKGKFVYHDIRINLTSRTVSTAQNGHLISLNKISFLKVDNLLQR